MTTRRPDASLPHERPPGPYGPSAPDRGRAVGGPRTPLGEAPKDRAATAREGLRRATRGGLLAIGAAALLGSLQVLFMIGVELDRTIRHRAAIESLEAELDELAREAESLRAIEGHARDDAYREQLARAQGFMYPDETRVVVLPTPGAPAEPVPPAEP